MGYSLDYMFSFFTNQNQILPNTKDVMREVELPIPRCAYTLMDVSSSSARCNIAFMYAIV